MQPANDLRHRQLLEADLLHYDSHCINQHGVLRHRYVGSSARRGLVLPQAVHLGDLDAKELGNHLGLEGRLVRVGPAHHAELLDLHALGFLLQLPLAKLPPASVQRVIVVRMAGVSLLACDGPPLLDLYIKPGASDVELLGLHRPSLALKLR